MKEDKLDKAFSLFIRLRDSNENGQGRCWTCGKLIFYKEGHCGHFISRRQKATRFHEQNCGLQCVSCNIFNQGKQFEFSIAIDNTYGEGTADKLLMMSRMVCKRSKVDIDVMTKHYREKVKVLIASKRIAA